MVKMFFLVLILHAPFVLSKPAVLKWTQAEDFDDSDLADIEGVYENNLDEEEEAAVPKKKKPSKDRSIEKDFNELEYELVEEGASSDMELVEDFDDSDLADIDGGYENNLDEEEEAAVPRKKKPSKDRSIEKDFNELEYESVEEGASSDMEFVEDESIDTPASSIDETTTPLADESLDNTSPDISDKNESPFDLDNIEDNTSDDSNSLDVSTEDDSTLEESLSEPDDSDFESNVGDTTFEDEDTLNLVSNIRFIASKNQLVIDTSETTSYQTRKNKKNNQLIIEILQSKLSPNLKWPYILKDFNTQFGLVKADQKTPDRVRVIIQLKDKAEFPNTKLSEEGNQILIGYGDLSSSASLQTEDIGRLTEEGESANYLEQKQILPARTLEELYFGKITFSGKPISFHVIDAPIKQVLRFISEESGLNMVIDEKVQGSVTLKLENIPWDQALYTIFKVKSLGYTRDGNVITILPLQEIENRTKKLKEITAQQKPLIPLITKVIPVTYGKLSEIESKVKHFLTPSDTANKQEGGKIIVHEESNTFVVIDTQKAIEKIEKLITYLDKTPKQVMIQAKIVQASENFTKSFGLTWSLGGNLPATINVSGLLELIGNISGSYKFDSANGQGELQLSGLPFIGDVGANLSIAEGENYAKVISSPKVVTISGKKASITRNTPITIPKAVTTNVQGDQVENFETEDIKIQLDVTPTVTSKGSVFLDVSINRSDPGGSGGAFKTTRTATTEVLVQNGHTVVIGGIYEEDEVNTNEGIPFMRKIPFLNLLFNRFTRLRSKNELLVFLTPRLLDIND